MSTGEKKSHKSGDHNGKGHHDAGKHTKAKRESDLTAEELAELAADDLAAVLFLSGAELEKTFRNALRLRPGLKTALRASVRVFVGEVLGSPKTKPKHHRRACEIEMVIEAICVES